MSFFIFIFFYKRKERDMVAFSLWEYVLFFDTFIQNDILVPNNFGVQPDWLNFFYVCKLWNFIKSSISLSILWWQGNKYSSLNFIAKTDCVVHFAGFTGKCWKLIKTGLFMSFCSSWNRFPSFNNYKATNSEVLISSWNQKASYILQTLKTGKSRWKYITADLYWSFFSLIVCLE